ncbi:MAG: hypothetical protein LBQ43_03155 [Holosporales bacterium]|nr:hypothetical protein [Holosporales bacterium]
MNRKSNSSINGGLFYLVISCFLSGCGSDAYCSQQQVGGGAIVPQQAQTPELTEQCRQKADAGDPDACFRYANRLRKGFDCRQDMGAAMKYYEKAANLGDPRAQNSLAVLLMESGHANFRDKAKARELLFKSRAQGYSLADYNLGKYFLSGGFPSGGESNLTGILPLQDAASSGIKEAKDYLRRFDVFCKSYKELKEKVGPTKASEILNRVPLAEGETGLFEKAVASLERYVAEHPSEIAAAERAYAIERDATESNG